jgi:ubiquitin carboxyl-terminal hydrolase 25/28
VLAYEMPKRFRGVKDEELPKLVQEEFDFKRRLSSCRLVDNLKALFCQLIASDRKYIDPTPVLSVLVDDYGNELAIGDQKDIGEFNLVFLSRIEDGLEEARKDKQMDIEGKAEKQVDSPSKINLLGKE